MFRSKKLAVVVAGAVAALAVGSFALAAIPDNGVIHGCYKKDSGALRVYDAATNKPKACADNEVALDWNQQGLSNAYGVDSKFGDIPGDPNQWTTVASRTVPAGKYLLSAKLAVFPKQGVNIPATTVTCALSASGGNGGSSDYAYGTVASNGSGSTLVTTLALINNNTANFLQNGGTVSVGCKSAQPVIADEVQITALQVGSFDIQ